MDARGRWIDDVFIERLWCSLEYECIHLHAFETSSKLRAGLTQWVGYYNVRRLRPPLGVMTQDDIYNALRIEHETD